MVVLSHNGYADGGYGYGFTVYGDQTLAAKLNTAGKPVNLIIGGHSHTDLAAATVVGNTAVVQAHYAGRKVGRADFTVNPDGTGRDRLVADHRLHQRRPRMPPSRPWSTGYASDPAYLALINQPIGYTQIDLLRNYNGDSIMGPFIQDAVYGALNEDADLDQRRRHGVQQPGRHSRRLVRRRDRPGVWALANTPATWAGPGRTIPCSSPTGTCSRSCPSATPPPSVT